MFLEYFASEGFLPGYNFPRLPVSAYLPGERVSASNKREMAAISRPRFLAVSEFGPRSLIYHEGSRYRVDGVLLPSMEQDGTRTTSCTDLAFRQVVPPPFGLEPAVVDIRAHHGLFNIVLVELLRLFAKNLSQFGVLAVCGSSA